MPAFLLGLLKYVPFLGGLLETWTENKSRAAELRAEKELVEAKAFAKGRVSPAYLLKFSIVVVFVLFSIAAFVVIFFPGLFHPATVQTLKDLIGIGNGILESGAW